ncbi:MAG: ATP-binding protein [Planctomycetes bacterium]|nr:ATP-binding protein [Planctomycetota bacterium]
MPDVHASDPQTDSRIELERLVAERSADLLRTTDALRREVEEHRAANAAIERYQQQLRDMANALCLAGERERRAIAQVLHDHVGQALAFSRMRLLDLQSNAVFCGFEDDISHVLRLLDGCLRYTRDLTCELSPPRLYELGLDAALEWLAESYRTQHKVRVVYKGSDGAAGLDEEARAVLYAATRELLSNAVRHGRPANIHVALEAGGGRVGVRVRDDGAGFDVETSSASESGSGNRFGLFSLRERLAARRGMLHVRSAPGSGTEAVAEVPFAPGATS